MQAAYSVGNNLAINSDIIMMSSQAGNDEIAETPNTNRKMKKLPTQMIEATEKISIAIKHSNTIKVKNGTKGENTGKQNNNNYSKKNTITPRVNAAKKVK